MLIDNRKLGMVMAYVLFVFLGACAGQNHKIVSENAVEPIMSETVEQVDYVLRTGDVLKVEFYYNEKLSRQVVIRPDGKITLPLKGEVTAAGLTPNELKDKITSLFADMLKQPEVTVSVESFNKNNFVYILGEVHKPDYYAIESPTTVTQLLARAGVLTSTANLDTVLVLSRSKDGKPVGRLVNVNKILKEANLNDDLLLNRFDVVYVSQTRISKVNQFVDQYINRLIPSLFRVSYVIGRTSID